LDEIGDMSLAAQAKVLRALQENKITRVGGEKDIQVNVRVLAATNKNLQQEIRNGNFREDLYYRLSVVVIQSPALSERREDIPILAKAFLQEICQEYGLPAKEFTPEALQALIHFDWPGNVRELRNVVERLAIFSAKFITLQDIQDYVAPVAFSATGNRPAVMRETDLYDRFEKFQSFKDYVEREFIRHRLNRNGWNISKTADELDIQRSHLYHKMKEYGLEREENQH
jgi:DNA-binding NtrC family response regulator